MANSFDETKKYRDWCLTVNNYDSKTESWLFGKDCLTDSKLLKALRYFVVAKEIGEGGTPHLQCYFSFTNARYLGGVRKALSDKGHFEPRKGTHEEAAKYCMKGEQPHCEWVELQWKGASWGKNAVFVTFGDLPANEQGKRTDLIEVKNEILAGKKIDDLCLEDPMLYHQYGRTLHKLEDLRMRKVYRTEMTLGTWLWGGTGVGKTFTSMKDYTPETHYIKPLSGKDVDWWDDYNQQEIVVINEFRGEIPYSKLLELVDKWPLSVSRRNRPPLPFISKKVIITSVLHPSEVYRKTYDKRDSIDQLYRRFEIIHLKPENNPNYIAPVIPPLPEILKPTEPSEVQNSGTTISVWEIEKLNELKRLGNGTEVLKKVILDEL